MFCGDARWQTESFQVTTDADSRRLHWSIVWNLSSYLRRIHITGVYDVTVNTVVFLNDRIKDVGEVSIRVLIACVYATVLVLKLHSTSDCFGEGEFWVGRFVVCILFPYGWCHVFSNQTIFGFDDWKLFIFIKQLHHSIDHILNKFNFSVSKTMFVGDVVSIIYVTTGFTTSTSSLHVELLTPLLQCFYTPLVPPW